VHDAPHPRAEVREIAELEWHNGLWRVLEETEQLVRRTLALASEFAQAVWPSDVELSANPVAAAWQLAAISPLNALDQLTLLGSTSFAELLAQVSALTEAAALALDAPWPDNEAE
jgi:hypothetical protein